MVSGLTMSPPTNETTGAGPGPAGLSLVHGLTATNTKDSLMVRWGVEHEYAATIQGFMVRYQALGSTVVQYSHQLPATRTDYEIMQLHENTYYDICVRVFTNLTHLGPSRTCIKATTSTDSLSVALGSTFGAFLALGVIVFFVFIAKWNHNRKMAKHHQQVELADSYESVDQRDDLELSEVSLAVNEDTAPLDVSSSRSSSQYSAPPHHSLGGRASTANGTGRHSTRSKHSQSLRRPGEIQHGLRRSDHGTSSLRRLDTRATVGIPEERSPNTSPPPLHQEPQRFSPSALSPSPASPTNPNPTPVGDNIQPPGEAENPFAYPDGRPPDVRPKQSVQSPPPPPPPSSSSQDPYTLSTSAHAGLRPNLSCPNWLAQS